MLAEVDLLLRGAVIGISVLTFVVMWLHPEARAKSWSVGGIAIALTGMMAVKQGMTDVWSPEAKAVAEAAEHMMPLAMTWFVIDVFLERSDRGVLVQALFGLAAVATALCYAPPAFFALQFALNIVLDLGLVFVILRSARGDLLERRRSFRVVFVTLMVGFGILKAVIDVTLAPSQQPDWLATAFAMAFLGFAVAFAQWALRPGSDFWNDAPSRARRREAGATVHDGADAQVLTRIRAAMQAQMWRQENLTIGAMASELAIPEHRLRRAINTDLGFRNFSAFVNGYRIDAAKAALSDPANAGRTILEIAYDVGFASLGPFNRAFRADTGQSPSDFRRAPDNGCGEPCDGVAAE